MNTIYILGKKGFRHAVSRQLGKTCRVCLPGEMLDHSRDLECQVYWLPESLSLPVFKRKVGSFIVFKYRLRFQTAEEYYAKNNSAPVVYSEEEKNLLEEMLSQERRKMKKSKTREVALM